MRNWNFIENIRQALPAVYEEGISVSRKYDLLRPGHYKYTETDAKIAGAWQSIFGRLKSRKRG
jgi:hypothetical protein